MSKDLNKILKQVKKMQNQAFEMQQRLEGTVYEATAGGGMVRARVSGRMELVGLTIAPDIIDPQDPETLCATVRAAVNEAIRKAHEDAQSLMSGITRDLGMPGGGLP